MDVYSLHVLSNLINKMTVNKNISKTIYKLFVGMTSVTCHGGHKNTAPSDDLSDVF